MLFTRHETLTAGQRPPHKTLHNNISYAVHIQWLPLNSPNLRTTF